MNDVSVYVLVLYCSLARHKKKKYLLSWMMLLKMQVEAWLAYIFHKMMNLEKSLGQM